MTSFRAVFFALFAAALFLPACLADQAVVCDICGKTIQGKYYQPTDHATGKKYNLCAGCATLKDRCFDCDRPILQGGVKLPDGRMLCARDAADSVNSGPEVIQMAEEVRQDMDRVFARYMDFPESNISIECVNNVFMRSIVGAKDRWVDVHGVTSSMTGDDGHPVQEVGIISHLLPRRVRHVAAHEFTHSWMNQNISPQRNHALDGDVREGFCEFMAYKYMESKHDEVDMKLTRADSYSNGKILVLLDADAKYGFNAVLDWIKFGDDLTLEAGHLERIRAINGQYVPGPEPAAPAAYALPEGRIAAPALDHLTLQSISGAPGHRFAMVNNSTFEAMEKGKVTLGKTKVAIQCLQINEDSAVVQVEGSNEKQVLKLKNSGL